MHVVDSHTGGMPTRVIVSGGPSLCEGPLEQQAKDLADNHKSFCDAVLREPRGQPGMVAALLVNPTDPQCTTGVIYFDVDAVLGMCGHGTIGLAVTLADMGRLSLGVHKIETPAGIVTVELHDANTVSVTNVDSRLIKPDVAVKLNDGTWVTGDFAYGGNWFFIVPAPIPVEASNIDALTDLAISIRSACHAASIQGPEGQPVDHVILVDQNNHDSVWSQNFVLCPDNEYDRSPCGTGSSALIACLAAKQEVEERQTVTFNSVIGSNYQVSYQSNGDNTVRPTIKGQAHVMAKSELVFSPSDPFISGIR